MPENNADHVFDPKQFKQGLSDKLHKLEASIEDLAKQIDCEHAFVSLATFQMMKMPGEGGYKEVEHGMVPALLELAAYHLYPHFSHSTNRDHGKYQQIFDLLEQLNSLRGLNTALEVDHSNSDLSSVQVKLLLHAESVRGSSYPPQTRSRIENIQGPHEKWFHTTAGIGPLRALQLIDAYEGLVNENLAAQQARLDSLTEKILGVDDKPSTSRGQGTRELVEPIDEALKNFIDQTSEVFAVSLSQINTKISNLTEEEWDAFANLVGTTKESRSVMIHPRDIRRRPVYFMQDRNFLLVDYSGALDAIFEAYDDLTRRHQKFRDRKYVPTMSEWMESDTTRCFEQVFPPTNVYSGLVYPDPDNPGGEAEIDGAILWGPFLILTEVKGKQFRPLSRLGNPARLRSDLKDNISEAFDQATRAMRFIQSTDSAIFKEKSSGRELTIQKKHVRRIFPVSVTLHHFGGLATQLALLDNLKLFSGASYPWSLSLADLETITKFAATPDVFLHYVQRRIELQESQEAIMADELDLFGEYLDTRLHPSMSWGRPAEEHGHSRLFAFNGGSERFDDWMQAEQGLDVKRPEIGLNLPVPFSEIIDELRKRDDDGARWIAFSLLSLSNEAIDRFTEGLEQLRSQDFPDNNIARLTFQEDGLIVSILCGKQLHSAELEKHTVSRCAIEKHRFKAERSLAIGCHTADKSKPFSFACWLEGSWKPDPGLDKMIASSRSRLLTRPGKKKIGRNDPCHCGSGKKFKKCCIDYYRR